MSLQSENRKAYMAAKYERRKKNRDARQVIRLLNDPILDSIIDEIIFEEE